MKPISKAGKYILCASLAFIAETSCGGDFLATQGHIKYQQQYFSSQPSSLDAFLLQSQSAQSLLDFRLIQQYQHKQWSFTGHYQLTALYGSAVEINTQKNDLFISAEPRQPDTALRLENTIQQDNNYILKQRLDRFYLAYSQNQLVVKIGRQALSWGNGLIFRPMDIFNPFSPDEVDSSYKSGTDMIYSQWLFDNGSDISFLIVPRREFISQQISNKLSSMAIKWHSFYNSIQTDLLLAKDYENTILAGGFNGPIKDAIWRTDLLLNHLNDGQLILSAVFNIETAWQWREKNIRGFIEYFHNGLGQKRNRYTLESLSSQLRQSISRQQIFNTGKNYIAYGLDMSWTPLLQISPVFMSNIDDQSAMFFIQGLYSYTQNMRINFGSSLQLGKQGSEFGGIETRLNSGIYLQIPQQIYARLSYYF